MSSPTIFAFTAGVTFGDTDILLHFFSSDMMLLLLLTKGFAPCSSKIFRLGEEPLRKAQWSCLSPFVSAASILAPDSNKRTRHTGLSFTAATCKGVHPNLAVRASLSAPARIRHSRDLAVRLENVAAECSGVYCSSVVLLASIDAPYLIRSVINSRPLPF